MNAGSLPTLPDSAPKQCLGVLRHSYSVRHVRAHHVLMIRFIKLFALHSAPVTAATGWPVLAALQRHCASISRAARRRWFLPRHPAPADRYASTGLVVALAPLRSSARSSHQRLSYQHSQGPAVRLVHVALDFACRFGGTFASRQAARAQRRPIALAAFSTSRFSRSARRSVFRLTDEFT